MGRLKSAPLRIGFANQARIAPAAKVADPFYASPEWKALRLACFQRDRFKCTEPGCDERACVADHIISRRNGGQDVLGNLRSMCRAHDNRVKEDHMGRRRGGS
jgi:5-methylcytosine-specific restriction endonuclease McrA